MSTRPDHSTLQQAAQWYARLAAAPDDARVRERWAQWHAQSEVNRTAWSYVERIGQRFQPLQADGDTALQTLRSARRAPPTRRQAMSGLAVLLGGALLGWGGWQNQRLRAGLLALRADLRSGTGEMREERLADGTHIWLNGNSALDLDFRSDLRRLLLLQGEVLIETARDDRPFVVESGQGRMRALGTRFSVTQQDGATRLAVFDGAVEIRTADGTSRQVIEAGSQVRFDSAVIAAAQPADPARQAWSKGILAANDMPLAAFVEELSRYRHGHIGVDPALADLRVMGSFPLHDSDRALAMLQGALPVRIQRTLPWWVSIEPR
ncbi:Protein FecR [compost metagenome]